MQPKQGYLSQVKQSNMSKVLRNIWEYEPISRIELVEKTELTSGTMTNLTHDLIKTGLIRESASSSSSVGRKRVLLRFDVEKYRIVGIDIGRSSFEVVVTDLSGRIIASKEESTVGINNPDAVLDVVAPFVQELISGAVKQGTIILGVGLSIPGPMDLQRGVLLEPPNFSNWAHYPVVHELGKRIGMVVHMNDDARTSALAERWFGLGRTMNNLLLITMGVGIGGGVVMNGELLYGANGLYGQVGHMTVVPGGELCACGNRGCWETVGSIPGILNHWQQGSGKTIHDFFQAVGQNDPEAAACFEGVTSIMVDTLTNLFNIYDPDAIVLSGKLYPFLAPYMPDITDKVKSRAYPFAYNRVRIEASTFGTSQSAVGAAAQVFDGLMKEPLTVLNIH